ncbi:MAG: small multi-drug export protein [Methanobacteriota archaeon]
MTLLSFLVSLFPFLELRFSIPLAIIYNPDISPIAILAICVILNILAIPIAYILLDIIVPPIRRRVKFVDRLFQISVKRAKKYQNLSLVGLALFVGVPLPITGAYTGVLIAYVSGFGRKRSSLAIATGVTIAGVIMWALATIGILFIQGITPS